MSLAVCLVSGGMDSCVAAAWALREEGSAAFLHITYGQRTAARELRAFERIAEHYRIERRLVVDLSDVAKIGGSALTDPTIEVPLDSLEAPGIPASYVPFRNGAFLSVAAGWAEVLGAESIVIGAVEEDGSGYPDCRRRFLDAFQQAVEEGTRPETRIRISAPLIDCDKSGIVKYGLEWGAPLHLTWSCYRESDRACGRCDSCRLRLRGFRDAGVEDPIPYGPSGVGDS